MLSHYNGVQKYFKSQCFQTSQRKNGARETERLVHIAKSDTRRSENIDETKEFMSRIFSLCCKTLEHATRGYQEAKSGSEVQTYIETVDNYNNTKLVVPF